MVRPEQGASCVLHFARNGANLVLDNGDTG